MQPLWKQETRYAPEPDLWDHLETALDRYDLTRRAMKDFICGDDEDALQDARELSRLAKGWVREALAALAADVADADLPADVQAVVSRLDTPTAMQ